MRTSRTVIWNANRRFFDFPELFDDLNAAFVDVFLCEKPEQFQELCNALCLMSQRPVKVYVSLFFVCTIFTWKFEVENPLFGTLRGCTTCRDIGDAKLCVFNVCMSIISIHIVRI
jgi:hypothetical protein